MIRTPIRRSACMQGVAEGLRAVDTLTMPEIETKAKATAASSSAHRTSHERLMLF